MHLNDNNKSTNVQSYIRHLFISLLSARITRVVGKILKGLTDERFDAHKAKFAKPSLNYIMALSVRAGSSVEFNMASFENAIYIYVSRV